MVITVSEPHPNFKHNIEQILGQTHQPLEVLVVEDPRSESAEAILRDLMTKHHNLHYHRCDKPGPAAARNLGVAHAAGEIILFTDDDCTPESVWLERILPHFQKPNVTGVRGNIQPLEQGYLTTLLRENLYIPPLQLHATDNLALRKDHFTEVGGFDESFDFAIGEDLDLGYRLRKAGKQIVYEPEALVHHDFSFNTERFLRREYRFGRGLLLNFRKHRTIETLLPSITAPYLAITLTLTLLNPLFAPLLALGILIAILKYAHYLKTIRIVNLPPVLSIYFIKHACNSAGFVYEALRRATHHRQTQQTSRFPPKQLPTAREPASLKRNRVVL